MKLPLGDPQYGDALLTAAVDAAQQMIIVDDRVRPLAKSSTAVRRTPPQLCRAVVPRPRSTGRGSTSSYDRKRRSACHPTSGAARQTRSGRPQRIDCSTTVPFREPTMIVVESHGMFGWFHWVQANRPFAESSGVE